MPAKIPILIGPDNFELIGAQLGAILLVELSNQAILDTAFTAPEKVYLGRFVPYNTLTESPYVNIRYNKGEADERSREATQVSFMHTFSIEVSACGKSTADAQGDQLATKVLWQLIRKIRAILANPVYKRLGLNSLPIARRYVSSIEVFEPMEMDDATNQVNGQIELCVVATESAEVPAATTLINDVTTTVKLNETEKGYFWEFKQKSILVAATGAEITNSFFSAAITEIDSASGAAYYAGTDFTQDGTTITATTFTFTEGQTIIAKT